MLAAAFSISSARDIGEHENGAIPAKKPQPEKASGNLKRSCAGKAEK